MGTHPNARPIGLDAGAGPTNAGDGGDGDVYLVWGGDDGELLRGRYTGGVEPWGPKSLMRIPITKNNGKGEFVAHGKGKYWGDNNAFVGGIFEDGCLVDGNATIGYVGGKAYEGDVVNNQRHGKGTLRVPGVYLHEGKARHDRYDVYDGQWVENKLHGECTTTFADGAIFCGTWDDNQPHGCGTYTSPDGTVYIGTWARGVCEEHPELRWM